MYLKSCEFKISLLYIFFLYIVDQLMRKIVLYQFDLYSLFAFRVIPYDLILLHSTIFNNYYQLFPFFKIFFLYSFNAINFVQNHVNKKVFAES